MTGWLEFCGFVPLFALLELLLLPDPWLTPVVPPGVCAIANAVNTNRVNTAINRKRFLRIG